MLFKDFKSKIFSANSPNFDDNHDLTYFLMDIKDVKYMKFKTVSRLGFISPSLPPLSSFRRTLPPPFSTPRWTSHRRHCRETRSRSSEKIRRRRSLRGEEKGQSRTSSTRSLGTGPSLPTTPSCSSVKAAKEVSFTLLLAFS